MILDIDVDAITVNSNTRRQVSDISELTASILTLGLLNPITVAPDEEPSRYRLVAGGHRLAAVRRLGWEKVPANVLTLSGLEAELAMIDENLLRNELNCLERSEQMGRRKEIEEALEQVRKHGGDRKNKAKSNGQNDHLISFADKTAQQLGVSARTVRREVQIAERIAPDVKDVLRETPVADSKTELLELARQKPEVQRRVAERIAQHYGLQATETKPQSPGLSAPTEPEHNLNTEQETFIEMEREVLNTECLSCYAKPGEACEPNTGEYHENRYVLAGYEFDHEAGHYRQCDRSSEGKKQFASEPLKPEPVKRQKPVDVRQLINDVKKEQKREEIAARPVPEPQNVPARIEQVNATDTWPLEDNSVDLIVTSPPYGLDIEYAVGDVEADRWEAFMETWMREAFRVAGSGGRMCVNVPLDTNLGGYRPTYVQTVNAAIRAGWKYKNTIVWEEGNTTSRFARGTQASHVSVHVITSDEMVPVFYKGDWRRDDGLEPDISYDNWLKWTEGHWKFGGESRAYDGHPAPFPEELPRRLIQVYSGRGAVVLDPFCGSGTTVKVATQLQRKAIGFDLDEQWVASARRRVMESVMQ